MSSSTTTAPDSFSASAAYLVHPSLLQQLRAADSGGWRMQLGGGAQLDLLVFGVRRGMQAATFRSHCFDARVPGLACGRVRWEGGHVRVRLDNERMTGLIAKHGAGAFSAVIRRAYGW